MDSHTFGLSGCGCNYLAVAARLGASPEMDRDLHLFTSDLDLSSPPMASTSRRTPVIDNDDTANVVPDIFKDFPRFAFEPASAITVETSASDYYGNLGPHRIKAGICPSLPGNSNPESAFGLHGRGANSASTASHFSAGRSFEHEIWALKDSFSSVNPQRSESLTAAAVPTETRVPARSRRNSLSRYTSCSNGSPAVPSRTETLPPRDPANIPEFKPSNTPNLPVLPAASAMNKSIPPSTAKATQNLESRAAPMSPPPPSRAPHSAIVSPIVVACLLLHALLLSPSAVRCQTAVDQCQGHLCENGGVCVDRGYDYTCNCSSALGYTGWYCNVTLNQTCADNPCQNGASCSIVGSSFECSSCSSLYEGPLCENQRDVCGVNNYTLCQNGGTCRLDASKTEGYRCECDPDRDFEGTTCSSKIEDCQNINCNNGVCKDGVRNYTCLCNPGWRGGQCDQKIDICSANPPYCQHGTCSNQGCQCDPFYQGEGCDEDKNECELDEPVCKNGGSCTNKEGGFNCNCTIGFRGNTCSEAFCDTQCYNGSTCNVDSGAQNWTCACPEYVEGRFCETQGPCFARPCDQIKTETCDQSIEKDTFTCNCKKGWEGIKCQDDLNECTTTDSAQKHLCVDGQGVCNNTQGSYTCDCVPGFTGKYCQTDIDDCTPNPCLHGGRCTDLVNNFTCDCLRTGYEGLTCESDVNECKSSPPVCNHGNCSNTVPGFNCVCGDRWRGQFCQRENPCYNISCQHGGTCQENVTLIEDRCACVAGYEGALCEKASASTDDSGPDLGVIIGPIVGGVVLLIIIIVLIAFFMTARSKRATRGAYSPSAQENAGSQVEQGGVLKKPPEERLI
ncbi:hypothetical protein RRG08_035819 [Elysia crispata]|uniref:EGF-like domain-containing protein n=1 Tax=Elysia crispata TaxID=231223 RepID=A0AAE1E041_9GAST|nr:hypothetical protein RRG08_035819 [Elysia crispata]